MHAAMILIHDPELTTGLTFKEEYMKKTARPRAAIPGKTTRVKPPALFDAKWLSLNFLRFYDLSHWVTAPPFLLRLSSSSWAQYAAILPIALSWDPSIFAAPRDR
jgi:hypothetical protein